MESQQLCTMAMAVCKRLVMVEHDETLANPLNILESKKSFHSFTIEAQWAKISTNCVQTKTLFIFASENHSSNCTWLGNLPHECYNLTNFFKWFRNSKITC